MLFLLGSSLCILSSALTPRRQSYYIDAFRTTKFDKQERNHIPTFRGINTNSTYISESKNITGICGPNAMFSLDTNGHIFIYGRGKMFNYSTSNSPFLRYAQQIKSILIGNEITTIGTYSFSNCNYLESVELGRNIEKIFDFPFYNCNRLKSIKFSGSSSPICSKATFSNISQLNLWQISIQIEDSNYLNQAF